MNEDRPSPTALSEGDVVRVEERAPAVPPPPAAQVGPRWSAGRVISVVIGSLLVFVSLILLGSGGTALWVDLSKRDGAGYLTTDPRVFSTPGAALTTRPTEFDPTGVDWFTSPGLLDRVRIRVNASDPDATLFVGIGPTAEVDRYLAGVRHTLITDFWGGRTLVLGGDSTVAAPETQDFWVASDVGQGARTLEWDPTDGSWTVVVMNADGRAGIDAVTTDLGATVPALVWVAVGVFAVGAVFLAGGVLLIVAASRRRDTGSTRT
jgi:hypothetical protein